jgi:hypothetical protein
VTPGVLPRDIASRYPTLPSVVSEFIVHTSDAVSPTQKTWLLCLPDFRGRTGAAFAWDEFEQQSLKEAHGDDHWTRKIRAHWDRFFPIMLSVKNCYAYFAVDLQSGAVVQGEEPEYEEVTSVADSFESFLEQLATKDNALIGLHSD